MDDKQRIELVKQFLTLHVMSDLEYFIPEFINGDDDNEKYLRVYHNMVKGAYSYNLKTCMVDAPGHYSISLSKNITKSGSLELIEWVDKDYDLEVSL